MTDQPPEKRKPGRPKGSTKPKVATDLIKNRPKTAKARLEEYLRTLPKATLNDITLLENMVAIEIEMDRLRTSMPTAKDGLEARKISETLGNYSKEYRLIQDSLGIGRNKRSSEIDMQQEIDALVAESTELVEKAGVKITCTVCKSDYQMGVIIFHFKDEVPWLWVFACPKCGTVIQIAGIKEFPKEIAYEPGQELILTSYLAGGNGSPGGDQADRNRNGHSEDGPVP